MGVDQQSMTFAKFTRQPKNLTFARKLRNSATPAERQLWRILSPEAKRLGLHFRRQVSLPPYIADFLCHQTRLIVELDGYSHDSRLNYDHVRDAFLRHQGYHILRFTNDEVYTNVAGVVVTVLAEAQARSLALGPPP